MSRILARVVAIAAIALGLCIVLVWVTNLALLRAATDAVGTDGIVTAMIVLGWVELGLSIVLLGGLATGVWLHRPLWARGVASVTIGLVLHWGWWLLDRRVDLFGTVGADPASPDLAARIEARMWTTLAVDAVAVVALLLGGVLLLRHARGSNPGASASAPTGEVAEPLSGDVNTAERPA